MEIVGLVPFAAMAAASPVWDTPSLTMLTGLEIFQFLEHRVAAFQTPRGMMAAVGIKRILCNDDGRMTDDTGSRDRRGVLSQLW